jgi:hypothetical protein
LEKADAGFGALPAVLASCFGRNSLMNGIVLVRGGQAVPVDSDDFVSLSPSFCNLGSSIV